MAFPLSIYIPRCPSQCPHRSPPSLVTILAIPIVLFPFLLPQHYSCPLLTIPFFLFVSSPCHHSHCAHGYFCHLIIILIVSSPILPSWHFIVLVKTKLGQLQTTMSHSNRGLGQVACFGMALGHPSNVCHKGRDFFGNSSKEWWDNKARLSSCGTMYMLQKLGSKVSLTKQERICHMTSMYILIWHSQWPS
jgi:hypothetical protein